MRRLVLALFLALLAPLAAAGESEFDKLMADPDRKSAMEAGLKSLKQYFKLAAEVDAGKSKRIPKRDEALQEFLAWLDDSEKSVGQDLRSKPDVVIEMFDYGRLDIMLKAKTHKAGRGKIEYFKESDPQGLERFEYSLLLPSKYKGKSNRYPLVVSLHERVINARHPAFRGNKPLAERSRVTLHNGWLKSPAAEEAIVVAPTGSPNGFRFSRDPYTDLAILMRAMGAGLTNFRSDWDAVFLEVHGEAVRVLCEQTFLFAGFILRDREGVRKLPIPQDQLFMFENLNGTPMLYIADEATWDGVGKPFSDALEAAYKKAGKPENLTVIKDQRDANGALKGDPAVLAKFVKTHRRNKARKQFQWRYFQDTMKSPLPITIGEATYLYDPDAELKVKAGALNFKSALEKFKDEAGAERFHNLVDITLTEAQSFSLLLYDGVVDMAFPITVRVNGTVIHDKVTVKRDWRQFITYLLPRRFFMVPLVGSLDCAITHKPQYVPKKEEKKAAEADPAAGKK